MNKILKSFWNWLRSLTTVDEKAIELYDEAKDRVEEVKKEIKDVKKAVKEVASQSKDVVSAVKGKKKRGRKPNNKIKTNNSKKTKK